MAEEPNGKVDLAILRTLLQSLKEKVQELQSSQADFLKDWPNYVAKLGTIGTRLDGLERDFQEFIEGQRFSWTTFLSVASIVSSLALAVYEFVKH